MRQCYAKAQDGERCKAVPYTTGLCAFHQREQGRLGARLSEIVFYHPVEVEARRLAALEDEAGRSFEAKGVF